MSMPTVRLAQISDLHVPVKPLDWSWRDYFNKRLTGWVNVRWFGRAKRFAEAELVLRILVEDLRERKPDRILFSGDASMFGFPAEFHKVAELLRIDDPQTPPGLAVPGNHDYYTRSAVRHNAFEKTFAEWQTGFRVDEKHRYPFAQTVEGVHLIGLNSARSNFFLWDAGGGVGRGQRERLRELLQKLPPGPRIIVTHYPIFLANGHLETRWRRMRDWSRVLEIAKEGGVSLWLHGHRHHGYVLPVSVKQSFVSVCVGSSTQKNLWSYNEYEVEGNQVTMRKRQYSAQEKRFVESAVERIV